MNKVVDLLGQIVLALAFAGLGTFLLFHDHGSAAVFFYILVVCVLSA